MWINVLSENMILLGKHAKLMLSNSFLDLSHFCFVLDGFYKDSSITFSPLQFTVNKLYLAAIKFGRFTPFWVIKEVFPYPRGNFGTLVG